MTALGAVLPVILALTLVTERVAAGAQQAERMPRIGFLAAASPPAVASRIEAFRQGLRDRGYVEGTNVVVEYRYAGADLSRLRELADELVRIKVDVIVSGGPIATRLAREATVTIPIVMGFDTDPVGSGFVASLARPGGNVTGLSALSPELGGKQLELLREVLPGLSRVAVLGTSTEPANPQMLSHVRRAAAALDLQLQYREVRSPTDLDTAIQGAARGRAEAVLVLTSPVAFTRRTEFAELAVKSRLPTMFWASEFVQAGGLMSYGVSFGDLFRRAATYVDRILKGVRPADLPVEQPTKFELVINLRTAKALGLTVPPAVLGRADEIIE